MLVQNKTAQTDNRVGGVVHSIQNETSRHRL